MTIEVDKSLVVPKTENRWRLPNERAIFLMSGIGDLRIMQEKDWRSIEIERKKAQEINNALNCGGNDKFSSPTFLSLVSCSRGGTILNKDNHGGCVELQGKFLFLGLVQGDEGKPWAVTSDRNKWFLKFGTREELESNTSNYAPIKNIFKIMLNASIPQHLI